MRKLGASLNVEAMSLYNHVSSKDDLLQGVANLLLESMEFPPRAGDWRGDIHALCDVMRGLGHVHPNLFPLLLVQSRMPSLDAWRPVLSGFSILTDAGVSPSDAAMIVEALSSFVVGFVLFEINGAIASVALRHVEGDGKAPRPPVGRAEESGVLGRQGLDSSNDGESMDGDALDGRLLGRFLAAQRARDLDESFRRGIDLLLEGVSARHLSR